MPPLDLWARLSERTQHLVCLIILLAVSVGFFAPVHFSERSLVGGDTVQWRAMAQYSIEHRDATGEEPLWAPNAFAGMPAYMINYPNAVPQIDDVPRWLRRVLWPSSHFIVLLAGTYLLVFFLTRSTLAGVISAVGFGLTTYLPVILSAGHNSKFVSLAFVPWVVLAFVYTLRKPHLLAALLFAVALAANFRAGHIQPTYYLAFLLGVWWIAEGVTAVREKTMVPFVRTTGWLALGAVLAVLMVAQPYLAHAEYRAFTIRGAAAGGDAGGLDWTYAMSWSQGPAELLTLFVANAFGGSTPTYWGPKPFTEGSHYVGGIILLLSGLALWQVRTRTVRVLGIAALLTLLFSLGEYFPLLNRPMFGFFPLFNALRVPETWLSVTAFILALLAGYGAWHAARAEPTPEAEAEKTRRIYIVTGAAVGLALVLLIFRGAVFDFEAEADRARIEQQLLAQQPELSPDDLQVQATVRQAVSQLREMRETMFADDALRTIIFLGLAGLALVLHRRRVLPPSVMLGALALLVLVDLWGVGRRYVNEDRLVMARSIEDRIPEYDFDRFLVERQQEAGGMGRFRVISFEGGNPMTLGRPSYFHESLGGYHGAKLRVYQDYLEQLLFAGPSGISTRALDLMNTRYVIAPNALWNYRRVYQSQQTPLMVLENPNALPRAFLVGEVEIVESAEATWDRILDEEFDPSRVALLNDPIDFAITPIDTASVASVDLVSYTPRQSVWQVESDSPRLLVMSEVYYPAGWHATVGGEEVPILRANFLLRAIPVSAGRHEIVMRFDPTSHRIGVWVAGGATAVVYLTVVLLLAIPLARRRGELRSP